MDPADSARLPRTTTEDQADAPQQVMSPTLSVGASRQGMQAAGHAVLAGEDRGPDYRAGIETQGDLQDRPQVPNGVPPAGQQQRADRHVDSGNGFQSPMPGTDGDYVAAEASLPAQSGLGRITAPGATTS